ncbi:hypothetical protein [Methylophilus sp.]|jgi:hypothetical protein|uniref:hypothetical protein n=1 Tax=Methylophilus sp. TaxID=29541 RepID=UPI0011D96F18|nr:hypothetical protein [Methylophilus sp.]TXI46624.1 MAG: hypothetical protein E6Q52_03625 [Methylophilus sp.]
MKSNRSYSKFVFTLLFMMNITPTFALAGGVKETPKELTLTRHDDGTFSIVSKSVRLEVLLSKIREKTNVDIYVDNELKQQPISIDAKSISLIQLLQHIAGDNYAIVYDGDNIVAMHMLSEKATPSTNSTNPAPDFSGQVKIRNQHAKMFFMPANNSESAINNYIKKRHQILSKLVAGTPKKELHAQLSFPHYISSEQLVATLKQKQLDPVTLNIGWKENGGGYDLKSGESTEDAIKSASLHHARFVSQLLEDANLQVETLRQQGTNDDQMIPALEFQKNANDLNTTLKQKGIQFYGVRVAATAEKLLAAASDNRSIRLVDPLWGGTIEYEITHVYPTIKIAIPIAPQSTVTPDMNEESEK